MEGVSFHHFYLIYMHYEKSFPLKPHYIVTRALKQLIYNYITIRVWKYGKLINKMPFKKIKELYYTV
jgi:hypothetical protein